MRLPSTCLCCREIWVSPKIGYFLWDFVPNSGLRKFRQGKSIALSTKLVVFVDSKVCWWHLYENRRVVAVYYKSVNCNPLTQLLRLVVDFSYKLFYSWQDFDWHSALRGPAAVAELVDNAINLPWRNYLSLEFGTKSQREVPQFLEIPKFPYNTVWNRWKEAKPPCQKPARFVQSFRDNTGLVSQRLWSYDPMALYKYVYY